MAVLLRILLVLTVVGFLPRWRKGVVLVFGEGTVEYHIDPGVFGELVFLGAYCERQVVFYAFAYRNAPGAVLVFPIWAGDNFYAGRRSFGELPFR